MKKDRVIVRTTAEVKYIRLDCPAEETVAGIAMTPTTIPAGVLVGKYRHESLLDANKNLAEKPVRQTVNAGRPHYYTP